MTDSHIARVRALQNPSQEDRERAERIAEVIGVTLGTGLMVNGHHGGLGCGSYDLALSLVNEWVYCVKCDAADLVTEKMMEATK